MKLQTGIIIVVIAFTLSFAISFGINWYSHSNFQDIQTSDERYAKYDPTTGWWTPEDTYKEKPVVKFNFSDYYYPNGSLKQNYEYSGIYSMSGCYGDIFIITKYYPNGTVIQTTTNTISGISESIILDPPNWSNKTYVKYYNDTVKSVNWMGADDNHERNR